MHSAAPRSNRRYLWAAMEEAGLPSSWRASIWRDAERNSVSQIEINNDWLVSRVVAIRRISPRLPVDASNDDVKAEARRLAAECQDSIYRKDHHGGARVIVQSYALDWPGSARAVCERWWKRNLGRLLDTRTEEAARALGHVGGRGDRYVSEQTHMRKLGQRKASERAINAGLLVEESGEEYDLKAAIDASISNPKLRRAELMTRIKGCEVIAASCGHVGLFVTLTCASPFHPVRADGSRNELWHGETVKDGQGDLLAKWARVRARWAKRGLPVYGLRVAEPHRSGTVHWHAMIFVHADHVRRVLGHLLRVFRADYRNVPSRASLQHRVQVVRIDPSKGTAAGYVAKYVSKNIDGHGLEEADKTGARRVRSWASAHRIRQFTFIGGPPVGVWREVRRMHASDAAIANDTLQAAFTAVNKRDTEQADWSRFVVANGGIHCPRVKRPIQLEREFSVSWSAYGEPVLWRLRGVRCGLQVVDTRVKRWAVLWGGKRAGATGGEAAHSRTRVNNCNRRLLVTDKTYGHDDFKKSQLLDIGLENWLSDATNDVEKSVRGYRRGKVPGAGRGGTVEGHY